jgi:hypothetical protein
VDLSKLIPVITKKLEEVKMPNQEQLTFIHNLLKELEEKGKDSFKAMKKKYAMMERSMKSLIKDQENEFKKA